MTPSSGSATSTGVGLGVGVGAGESVGDEEGDDEPLSPGPVDGSGEPESGEPEARAIDEAAGDPLRPLAASTPMPTPARSTTTTRMAAGARLIARTRRWSGGERRT
jgi:hypothetical protein